jgi:primase-polymerase (primpol)-like protein
MHYSLQDNWYIKFRYTNNLSRYLIQYMHKNEISQCKSNLYIFSMPGAWIDLISKFNAVRKMMIFGQWEELAQFKNLRPTKCIPKSTVWKILQFNKDRYTAYLKPCDTKTTIMLACEDWRKHYTYPSSRHEMPRKMQLADLICFSYSNYHMVYGVLSMEKLFTKMEHMYWHS